MRHMSWLNKRIWLLTSEVYDALKEQIDFMREQRVAMITAEPMSDYLIEEHVELSHVCITDEMLESLYKELEEVIRNCHIPRQEGPVKV